MKGIVSLEILLRVVWLKTRRLVFDRLCLDEVKSSWVSLVNQRIWCSIHESPCKKEREKKRKERKEKKMCAGFLSVSTVSMRGIYSKVVQFA